MNTSTAYKAVTVLSTSLVLSACGGGGGSGNGVSATLSIFSPTQVAASDLVQGTRSTNTTGVSAYGVASATLAARNISSSTTVSASAPLSWQLLPTKHITDTQAATAWADGWTGLGSSISVIDDFSTAIGTTRFTLNASRTYTDYFGSGLYNVAYRIDLPTSHGELVSNIAGGDGAANSTSLTVNLNSTSATLSSCVSGTCYSPSVYTSISDYLDAPNTLITYTKAAGVAKEALIANNNVDLSTRQDTASTLAAIASHVDNSYNMSAINLSIGLTLNTVGVSYDDVVSSLDTSVLSRTTDAVVVVAAGNSGAACTNSNLNGCNAIAVAASVLPQTYKSTIIAGATSGAGTSESIATYSSRAGILKDRYLLASGETGFYNTSGNEFVGTSFAAPRIAGAAAVLRQKFPNLNGEKTASILLLTANKDINNDGLADFTGTSDTYGHGKLDLLKALSPVGSLAVR